MLLVDTTGDRVWGDKSSQRARQSKVHSHNRLARLRSNAPCFIVDVLVGARSCRGDGEGCHTHGRSYRHGMQTFCTIAASINDSRRSKAGGYCPTQYQLPGASHLRLAGSAIHALDSFDTFRI